MSKEILCDICRKIISNYSWWGQVRESKVFALGKREMDVCRECMQLVSKARDDAAIERRAK